jgi:GrpB-like predicted nucleotidyltransferase (UPF0157 family)
MDAHQVTRELKREFPQGKIAQTPDENPTEITCEVEAEAKHPDSSRTIAVIDRVPGNLNQRSTLNFRVLKGTLNLFPYGQRQTLNVGDACTIEPHVFYWAEGDETWVEINATPAWTIQDRRVVGPEEHIQLQPHDPSWSEKFEIEKTLIERTLGTWIHGGLHHVGSTSVPGIAAKPIIDIMVGVHNLQRARECIGLLARIHYEHLASLNRSMLWFCKPALEHRVYHLYLIEPTSSEWIARLAFRDYLRSHPEARDAYEQLKWSLAQRFKDDRAAYTDAKGEFVEDIVRMALDDAGPR